MIKKMIDLMKNCHVLSLEYNSSAIFVLLFLNHEVV
jgi:hypothetical protein